MRRHQADAEAIRQIFDAHRTFAHHGLRDHAPARDLTRLTAVAGQLVQQLIALIGLLCHGSPLSLNSISQLRIVIAMPRQRRRKRLDVVERVEGGRPDGRPPS